MSEHGRVRLGPRLLASIVINIAILVAQLVGGVMAGSLALIADALHNLTDVGSLGLSYFAYRVARRPASERYTFAFQRAEVLAAVVNALMLVAVSVYIGIEGVGRVLHPQPVRGLLVVGFAAFGMIANGLAAWLLRGHGSDLNVRSAVLHLVSDSVASVGVLLAGAAIKLFGWYVVDGLVSIALGIWMVRESVGLIVTAGRILMQGVPDDLELGKVESAILATPGVVGLHDLRVWAVAPRNIVLSAHIVLEDTLTKSHAIEAIIAVKKELHDRFGVEHATLEAEDSSGCAGFTCGLDHASFSE